MQEVCDENTLFILSISNNFTYVCNSVLNNPINKHV